MIKGNAAWSIRVLRKNEKEVPGNYGKDGRVTVAPFRAWRSSHAEYP